MKRFAPHPARKAQCLTALALVLAPLSGCGGGAGETKTASATGRALTITFRWPHAPTRSRALPPSTQSVVVRVQDAQGFQDSQTINRPAAVGDTFGTAEFFALSSGTAQVQAQAYAAANGGGTLLAEAGANLTLSRGETEAVTLTFNPAYTNITLEPEAPGTSLTILQGSTIRLVARGTLADGTVIDPNPAGAFSTSSSSIATVSATGVVTGVGPGVATITFVDNSGRVGLANITVRGGDAEVNIN